MKQRIVGLFFYFAFWLSFKEVKSISSPHERNAIDYFSEANRRYGDHDFEGAVDLYKDAILLDGQKADYYCNYASVLYDLNRIDESESNYLMALSLDEFHVSSLFNYALLLQDRRQSMDAAALYKRVLVIEQENGDAYANLGSCLYDLARFEEAVLAFESAFLIYESTLDSSDENRSILTSNLYEYIGRCHARRGDDVLARESFRKAIDLSPGNSVASHMLASLDGSSEEIAPATYVSRLFDDYSSSFESSLKDLKYTAPSLIVDALRQVHSSYYSVVDLGSGTGLLGDELMKRNLATSVIGLDLSRKMLEVSIPKKCYTLLLACDIMDFLTKMISDKMTYRKDTNREPHNGIPSYHRTYVCTYTLCDA